MMVERWQPGTNLEVASRVGANRLAGFVKQLAGVKRCLCSSTKMAEIVAVIENVASGSRLSLYSGGNTRSG